jgi:molybdopterin-containing oxidoreductase family membrane subunit
LTAAGWRGTDNQWRHYSRAYLYLAALATPLVLSVHSVVSWDFAVGIVPGWHGTIFAPYFVAGAIYSGIGMVLTLIIPLRRALRIEHMITEYHFDNLAKLTLLTGSILLYAYGMEYFIAWYSGNPFEQTTFFRRAFGPMWWAGWTMIICNAFVSQLLWFRKIRTNITALFVISIFINIGMWFERYVIIVSSLSNDYMPWAWGILNPTWADWGILAGSFGWFGMWFMLFAKGFPIVAIQEIKEMIPLPRLRGSHHRWVCSSAPSACPGSWPLSSTSTVRWTPFEGCGPWATGTSWCTAHHPITSWRRP